VTSIFLIITVLFSRCVLLTSPSNPGSNTTRDKVRIREQSGAKSSLRTYTIVVNYGNIENRFAVNREETNVNVMLDTYVLIKTFNFVCVSEILI